jgi:phosphate:Na+ symporter
LTENAISIFVGGIGLFLLGMMLMTNGLKTAAGPMLGRLLASSTETRRRGLATGIFVTALVQSSSAVTVAAIGFVNAGLLGFGQSLWVLFGANVGTTMTGWLVALIGLKVNVEAAALPLVGIGMALYLSGERSRRGALGEALAGFGVLFLGIGFLQHAFSGVGSGIDLAILGGRGWVSVLVFVLAGLLLTVLMQSSSAALAIVLTLAETGTLPLQEAAATVIGANIGTTVTALLATIGATANAKRAASAHVLFNVITGLVALLLLPLLIGTVSLLRDVLALDSTPAVSLALFHTSFNLLGVALMWPLADRLALFLQKRFRTQEEELGRPRYLDHTVAAVPALAVDALRRELVRFGNLCIGNVRSYLAALAGKAAPGRSTAAAIPLLGSAIAGFVARLSRESMSAVSAEALARLLRIQRYFESCGELGPEISGGGTVLGDIVSLPLHAEIRTLANDADELLVQLDPGTEPFAPASARQREQFENRYQEVKAALLASGARGEIDIAAMESLLRSLSALRRTIDQASKAAHLIAEPPAA